MHKTCVISDDAQNTVISDDTQNTATFDGTQNTVTSENAQNTAFSDGVTSTISSEDAQQTEALPLATEAQAHPLPADAEASEVSEAPTRRGSRSFSRRPEHERKPWIEQALALEKRPRIVESSPDTYHDVVDLRRSSKQHKHYKFEQDSIENLAHLAGLPAYMKLDIRTIIDNLFLEEVEKREAHKVLVKITANLKAMGVLDERGVQEKGELIGKLRGIDGPFVYYCLMEHDLSYTQCRDLVEYLVDHDVIQRRLNRKEEDEKRDWIRNRLRERRQENPQISWDDVREEYEREFPRQLEWIEEVHQRFLRLIPHPELHGGKLYKNIWAQIEDQKQTFVEFVLRHDLEQEEGSLFTYLARVMKSARLLHEITGVQEFHQIENSVRYKLAVIDDRILDEVW